jgi:hypothetical protein
LSTEIPYWSDIERMSERRAPLCAYAPHSPAGLIYASLWREIQTRMTEALAPSQLVLHAGQGHRSTQAGALEVIESTTNSTLGMS